jgi:quercetin 2,3-dioxygenase
VRRLLPNLGRRMVGAWCFVDHYGPDDIADEPGMQVPPHPHTGLQTVSWLFAGEIEHRDSSGAHAMVRPGELNLMTAGRGIQHSEVSTPGTTMLHGVQLWTALPDAARHGIPFFERFVPPVFEYEGATVSVFLGSLIGHRSSATAFSPIVGAQFDLPAHTELDIPVDAGFEHGVLVDTGEVAVDGLLLPAAHLGYRPAGAETLSIRSNEHSARILLLGGAPFGEQIVMWWNFIGRSHEEVVDFRTQWQADVVGQQSVDGRFGTVRGYDGRPLPAPAMPNVRLRPRD